MKQIFLDLETSGLMHQSNTYISLMGFLTEEGIFQRAFFNTDNHPIIEEHNFQVGLDEVIRYLKQHPAEEYEIITYNGMRFDIPLCLKEFNYDLFEGYNHIDLMVASDKYFMKEERKPVKWKSKDELARMLGIYVPSSISGFKNAIIAKYPKARTPADVFQVFQHNAIDLCITSALYYEMRKYFMMDEKGEPPDYESLAQNEQLNSAIDKLDKAIGKTDDLMDEMIDNPDKNKKVDENDGNTDGK
jgi:uncharacterized protein YprB with RNaseH-like and TPR domain